MEPEEEVAQAERYEVPGEQHERGIGRHHDRRLVGALEASAELAANGLAEREREDDFAVGAPRARRSREVTPGVLTGPAGDATRPPRAGVASGGRTPPCKSAWSSSDRVGWRPEPPVRTHRGEALGYGHVLCYDHVLGADAEVHKD